MTQPLAAAPDLPRMGDRIAGKYLVEEVLGAGGMGVVVAARHEALRQRVAVKFLLPAALRLPEATARFLREARAAVAIQSEHVARVLDVGTLETGAPFMVMEYLAGTDFGRLLKQRGALPAEDAVDFVLQAGEAIAEAHLLGIIHRDLKPSNLFLTSRSEGSPLVKVLDFGLSKMTLDEEVEGSLTATHAVVGSPSYMSPEQIRSLKHVGPAADIWSLGVILHEMLTGRRPFEGKTLTAISASIVADAPPPIRSLRPDLPEGLEALVLACLAKDPYRRVQTVAELASRLAPFAPPRSRISMERIAKLTAVSRFSRPELPSHAPDDEPTRAVAAPEPITESAILSVSEAPAPAPPPPPAVLPAAEVSQSQVQPRGARLLPVAFVGGVVACVALLVVIAWLVLTKHEEAEVATAATATTAADSAPAPAPVPVPVPDPTPFPAASAVAPHPAETASARPAAPPAVAPPPAAPPSKATPPAPQRTRHGNPLDRAD